LSRNYGLAAFFKLSLSPSLGMDVAVPETLKIHSVLTWLNVCKDLSASTCVKASQPNASETHHVHSKHTLHSFGLIFISLLYQTYFAFLKCGHVHKIFAVSKSPMLIQTYFVKLASTSVVLRLMSS
jgi:hypothetical protein